MDLSNEHVIHVKKDGVEFLQFRRLLEYKEYINHAYSLGLNRNFRTSKANKGELPKEDFEKAMRDYRDLSTAIGADYRNLMKGYQAHTDSVKVVNGKVNVGEPDISTDKNDKADGLITNKTDILLSTTNADCILFLFFDPVKKVIANVNSGWRGTLKRISVKTIEKMKEEFGSEPKDIICCICPSIRKCHFEVGEDVKALFEEEFHGLKNIIEEKVLNEKWHIDTVLINKIILEKAGLSPENIIDSGICSVCNSDIVHSYRVEKAKFGLCTAVIELI